MQCAVTKDAFGDLQTVCKVKSSLPIGVRSLDKFCFHRMNTTLTYSPPPPDTQKNFRFIKKKFEERETVVPSVYRAFFTYILTWKNCNGVIKEKQRNNYSLPEPNTLSLLSSSLTVCKNKRATNKSPISLKCTEFPSNALFVTISIRAWRASRTDVPSSTIIARCAHANVPCSKNETSPRTLRKVSRNLCISSERIEDYSS